MSTSKVEFDLNRPPAISVTLEKIKNKNIIENCMENSMESYQDSVACIDREFDIKHLGSENLITSQKLVSEPHSSQIGIYLESSRKCSL